jgi:hypothetical protein
LAAAEREREPLARRALRLAAAEREREPLARRALRLAAAEREREPLRLRCEVFLPPRLTERLLEHVCATALADLPFIKCGLAQEFQFFDATRMAPPSVPML